MSDAASPFPVATFVNQLAIAWKRLAMYPPGHSALQGALGDAYFQLLGQVALTGSLSLGVSSDALVHEKERLDSANAAQVAAVLFSRNVAVLRFREGVREDELDTLLRHLRPAPGEVPPPLGEVLAEHGVTHIEAQLVDFSGVVVSEADGEVEAVEAAGASLWDRLLEQLLAGRLLSGGEAGPAEGSPSDEPGEDVVRCFLARYSGTKGLSPASATRGAAGGEGAGFAEENVVELLRSAVGAHLESSRDRQRAVGQIAELLQALPEGLRPAVLESGLRELDRIGDTSGLRRLATTASATEVVSAMRRLREESFALSADAVSLLEELVFASPGGEAAAGASSAQLAKGLRTLLEEEAGAASGEAQQLFFELPLSPAGWHPPGELEARRPELEERQQTKILLQLLIELLDAFPLDGANPAVVLRRLEVIFRTWVASGRWQPAVALALHLQGLAKSGGDVSTAARHSLDRLAGTDTAQAWVEGLGTIDEQALPIARQLLEALGPRLVRQLLIGLSEEQDLSRRRQIYSFLAELGSLVVPDATLLLADARWFVVRNMLTLLRAVGDRTSLPRVEGCLRHDDSRVRIEAVKSLVELHAELPPEIVEQMLADGDPKVAETMAMLLGSRSVSGGVQPLLDLLAGWDPLGRRRSLRLKALQSLGGVGDPAVLPRLARYFASHLAVDSLEERRAAYASLAGYPTEARQPYVRRGLRSRDPEIREICLRLEAKGPSR